jgi:hypothetical protein
MKGSGCPARQLRGEPAGGGEDPHHRRTARLRAAAPVPIERVDVDHRPLRAVPAGKRLRRVLVRQHDLAGDRRRGRGVCRAPGGRVEERPVRADGCEAVQVRDRPVSRNDHLGLERLDDVERAQPSLDGAGPHHRGRADEGDVGGEHDPRVGHVHDQVAMRMRRPHLDELDLPATDVELEPTAERTRGSRERDAAMAVRRRPATQEASARSQRVPRRVPDRAPSRGRQRRAQSPQRDHRPGLDLPHLVRRGRLGRDDLPCLDQLVAPPMVPVAVRVHQRADRRPVDERRHRVEHPPRQDEVPERVDEQRLALADHQSRVRLSPRAVRLQPRMDARRDLRQTRRVALGVAEEGRHEPNLSGWRANTDVANRTTTRKA